MKKLKAFWLRRSVATRLTALMALMLVLVCALWTWFAWTKASYEIRQYGRNTAHGNCTNIDSLLCGMGYQSDMPQENTKKYWEMRAMLASYSSNDRPYTLRYFPTANASELVTIRSPFIFEDADGLHDNLTYYHVDLSGFSEADLRAMQEHMQHVPSKWQGNSPYMTAYGMYIQSQTDYFVPNRIVSCIDGQSWSAELPVEEQVTKKFYFRSLFDSEEDMEHYFEALRYLNAEQLSLQGKTYSSEEWAALETGNYFHSSDTLTHSNGSISSTYVVNWSEELHYYFYNFPYLVLVLFLLLLYLFYKGVRRAVVYPLYDTTRQAQHVAHLEFDQFHPDTARGDEIGQLNRALSDMAGDLHARWDSERDLEDKRQQFVAAASHDLKTPLALIGGYAEAIAQDISPEENARYLAAIEQETGRMNELVHEMLDYTRLDRTDELQNRKTVDLTALTRSLLEEYAPLFENRRLTCDLMDGVRIRGDETLLRRAFGCLLENAARYSPDGGRISVTLRQAQTALLTVENDCEPIPEEELPRLFEMFYRGDKARSRAGGHGLGLAITRKILALHSLACRAENTKTGVRFIVCQE